MFALLPGVRASSFAACKNKRQRMLGKQLLQLARQFGQTCEKRLENLTSLGHAVATLDFLESKNRGSSHSWETVFICCKRKGSKDSCELLRQLREVSLFQPSVTQLHKWITFGASLQSFNRVYFWSLMKKLFLQHDCRWKCSWSGWNNAENPDGGEGRQKNVNNDEGKSCKHWYKKSKRKQKCNRMLSKVLRISKHLDIKDLLVQCKKPFWRF